MFRGENVRGTEPEREQIFFVKREKFCEKCKPKIEEQIQKKRKKNGRSERGYVT